MSDSPNRGPAFVRIINRYHTLKDRPGAQYPGIDIVEIVNMAKDPPRLHKDRAPGVIFSEYREHGARDASVQERHGTYWMLAADIDKGNPSIEQVEAAVDAALGQTTPKLIYATRSATEDNRKWRVVIPLAVCISGRMYVAAQTALIELLAAQDIQADPALARATQVIYLPNRDEGWQEIERRLVKALAGVPRPRDVPPLAMQLEAEKELATMRVDGGWTGQRRLS